MGQKARWVLPETVDPPTSTCYMVPVPDDPQHLAAFMGAIYQLAKPYSWQNDAAHTAIDVGAVWMEIFNNLEACMPQWEFRTVASCLLEGSLDGGATWVPIFDASACANEVIIERIEDGTLSAGGQPPIGGTGTPGQCYTYHVTLTGNQRWHAPIPVSVGDTIEVSDVIGGWYDGFAYPVGDWYCGDGSWYALGTCAGGMITDAGDPAPTLPHMGLIGNIASEASPFFDMFNTVHAMGAAGPDEFFLQPNDSTLSDNEGSLTFKVEICINNTCPSHADWTSIIDCTAIDGGFAAVTGSRVNGVGWQEGEVTDSGLYYTVTNIVLNLATAVEFVQMDVYYDVTGYTQINPESDWLAFTSNAPGNRVINQASGNGVNKTMAWQGSLVKSALYINVTAAETGSSGSGATGHIRTIILCGKGTKPPELP